MNEFFTNVMSWGFMPETINVEVWDWQTCCNFAIKCYNLFLAFFYFNILKFVVHTVQVSVRRFKRWTN